MSPLPAMPVKVTFHHPSDSRRDLSLDLIQKGPKLYQGELAPVHEGAWDLVITIGTPDKPAFTSRQRILLKS